MSGKLDHSSQVAPVLFIGKWTPKVLNAVIERPHRHGELRRILGSALQRMLTSPFRNLEKSGLISRQVTRSKSVSATYSLTKLGKTFVVPMRGVCRWSKRYGRRLAATLHF
jgi:DNA-binding HxlR family transcriptional regulator